MVTLQLGKASTIAVCVIAAWAIAACGKFGEQNLWGRDFAKPSNASPAIGGKGDVTGYWEGEISMGYVRAKIEPSKITLAIRCDNDGKIVAQGAAPVAFTGGDPAKMILQADLLSGGDEVCGFHFYKGNEFGYSVSQPGVLKLNFAGTSVSELRKLADLEAGG